MAKVTSPITFAEAYNIDENHLNELGVFNPTLAVDTNLFIDPLLLETSSHDEIRIDAVREYRRHFTLIIKLLSKSKSYNDVVWRSTRLLFQFHEIPGTCLGYGAGSISGSGFGAGFIDKVMMTAKEIVDLGIEDPDLFVALALFEEGIGPDRISDMTTNVIFKPLLKFNRRIIHALGLKTLTYDLLGQRCDLVPNPIQPKPTPVILLPNDILVKLPVATDWSDIDYVVSHNFSLRAKVNTHIGRIWEAKSRKDKRELKNRALSSKESFDVLLELIHSIPKEQYNISSDPLGLIKWTTLAREFTESYPLTIDKPSSFTLSSVFVIVMQIIDQFAQLIENNGLWKSLWYDNKPLKEHYSQRLFFATAYAYCKANNLDISPEADSGNGPVDFKISQGNDSKVLVEVKLSTNPHLIKGYTKQVDAYKEAEETSRAVYLVIGISKSRGYQRRLLKIHDDLVNNGEPVTELYFVDAMPRKSASQR